MSNGNVEYALNLLFTGESLNQPIINPNPNMNQELTPEDL